MYYNCEGDWNCWLYLKALHLLYCVVFPWRDSVLRREEEWNSGLYQNEQKVPARNFTQKNSPKKFSLKKIFTPQIFTQKIFTQIVRLSFVDLRWAQLYVSLVLISITLPRVENFGPFVCCHQSWPRLFFNLFFYNPFKYSNTFKATESTIPSRTAGRIFTFSRTVTNFECSKNNVLYAGKWKRDKSYSFHPKHKRKNNLKNNFFPMGKWFLDFSFWIKDQCSLQRAPWAVCIDALRAL